MEAIVRIDDKKTFQSLVQFLKSLNIEVIARKDNDRKDHFKSKKEFIALAGLWKGRDITIEKLREKAWPKRNW